MSSCKFWNLWRSTDDGLLTAASYRLGTFHNALPSAKQEAMKTWGVETYPTVWADVQKLSKRKKMSSSGGFLNGIHYNIGTDIAV